MRTSDDRVRGRALFQALRATAIILSLGAFSVLQAGSGAGTAGTASFERPGGAQDAPLERPRDLSGRSVKTPRVRAIHTDDASLKGGTAYLIRRDPWLAYQRGRELTQREFGARDGVFGQSGHHAGPLLEDGVTHMASRGHVASCTLCHNTPWRDLGGGLTFGKNGARGRNTPHLFGAGLTEMLGWQNRLDLLAQVDSDGNGWISRLEARGRHASLLTLPESVEGEGARVQLGRFDDDDGDGRPDLDPILAIWYVDSQGRRIPWARSLKDLGVAGYSFEYQVFGHGSHGRQTEHGPPTSSTLRAFTAGAFDLHSGLQAHDPTLLLDPDGDGISGTSLAGSRQFSTASVRDRGATKSAMGVSLDDPDRDGHMEEISQGDLDLAEWYQLNHPRPAERQGREETGRGRALFRKIGCAGCHVPDWFLKPSSPGGKGGIAYPGDRRFFDLSVQEDPIAGRLQGKLVLLADRRQGDWTPRRGSFVLRGYYSDLATHDLGDRFAEQQYDGSVIKRHRTPPLWGVGSTAPYGHDGASLDLDSVIRRHDGEAGESTRSYESLSRRQRSDLLAFLRSLVLYQTEELACDVDGDGKVSSSFTVAGKNTGLERLNPEWLFLHPGEIEGLVTGAHGSEVNSEALINLDAAYGTNLPWLRDSDGDGHPDRRDLPQEKER